MGKGKLSMTTQGKIIKIITYIIVLNIILIVGYLYFVGYSKSLELIKYNTILTFIAIGLFYLINHILWHLPLINKFFGSIPNLNGKWEATIINTNDKTKQTATIIITQTWLNTHVIIEVERGNSSTIFSEIIKINETSKLYFIWNASFDGKPFDGTTVATIYENKLDGHYFTNSNFDGKYCTVGSFKAKKLT